VSGPLFRLWQRAEEITRRPEAGDDVVFVSCQRRKLPTSSGLHAVGSFTGMRGEARIASPASVHADADAVPAKTLGRGYELIAARKARTVGDRDARLAAVRTAAAGGVEVTTAFELRFAKSHAAVPAAPHVEAQPPKQYEQGCLDVAGVGRPDAAMSRLL
jgi:hypothetical protein